MQMDSHDLPPEMLVEILKWARLSPLFTLCGTSTLVSVSQVCRRWRAVAIGTSLLWNDVQFSSNFSPCMLSSVLSRSGVLPISISLDLHRSNPNLVQCRSLLESVVSHRSCIRGLAIRAPIYILTILSRAISRIGNDFPVLEFLNVDHTISPTLQEDDVPTIYSVLPCRLNLNAAKLESLSVTGATITPLATAYRLKELHVDKSANFSQLDVSSIDQLETLSVKQSPFPIVPVAEEPIETRLVSLTLCDLRIADISPGDFTAFLSTIRMPCLEHLVIDGLFGYLWDEFIQCGQAGALHYPALRSVTLESVDLTAGLDEGFFRNTFSSVWTLRLLDVNFKAVLRILEGNPLVCPQLREIDTGMSGKLRIHGRWD
ncbi:hypothetical protein R3P38DRAFT_475971 [Favolaschia claudopus]|uniref:F-box domain-containing protein n=1 Tax=Favolaschia claudopus TaxID=2862362 RepID=A0AAW0CMW8_9AGAR